MIAVDKYFDQIPPVLIQLQSKNNNNNSNDYNFKSRVANEYSEANIVKAIRLPLRNIFFNKCAYCESKLDMLNITRFRPRRKYPWLDIEWSNFLPTCQACNISKGDRFPIDGTQVVVPSDNEALRLDSDVLAGEYPLLLHPAINNSALHFTFNELGEIIPNKNDLQAIATIDTFNLNRGDLIEKRRHFILSCQNLFNSKLQLLDLLSAKFGSKEVDELSYEIFREFIEFLLDSLKTEAEFSLLGYFLTKNFNLYFNNSKKINIEQSNFIKRLYNKHIKHIISNSIYENRREDTENYTNVMKHNGPVYLDSIHVQRMYCISDIYMNNLKQHKEIYILGENGDGKTLLLQAILLGLKWAYIKNKTDKKDTGVIHDVVGGADLISIVAQCSNKAIYSLDTDQYVDNVFAYGVHRSKRSGSRLVDKEGFISLFTGGVALIDPIDWLKELDRRSKYEASKKAGVDVKSAIKLFEDLLGDNVTITIDDHTGDLYFLERGTHTSFDNLSEGYKSVITWACDLLSRFIDRQPKIKVIRSFTGVVIVDEADLHLHPRWAKLLARKLRRWFPRVQFVFTTHNPSMVMGASNDAVFYRIYKAEGLSCISEPFYNNEMGGMMLNNLITSPLFGLEDARMASLKENETPDTSESYIHSQIYNIVQAQVNNMKAQGKTYISPQAITDMTKNAIKKLKIDE